MAAASIKFVIRPIKRKDLSTIYDFALNAGPGITSLVKDKQVLAAKIKASEKSFGSKEHRLFFFVLEEVETSKVIGTTAIISKTGATEPFYHYKISTVTHRHSPFNAMLQHKVLHLVNDYAGASELCTLFLHPDYRQLKLGPLLSRCRFLFLVDFKNFFDSTVIAEMRGKFIGDDSPFWHGLAQKFFPMDFATADALSGGGDVQFISDLMPRNPIYVCMLPKAAQQVIGKVDDATKPALQFLLNEGFEFNDYIDIFDGGPTIESKIDSIKTVKESMVVIIEITAEFEAADCYLISNSALDYRAATIMAKLSKNKKLQISKEDAKILKLQNGDKARIVKY